MTTHRFFIRPEQIAEGHVTICGPQARQICAVLRLHEGDEIAVLDGSGCCHIARIRSAAKDQVLAEITETRQMRTEPCVSLTLAQALPKGDKVELVVQKTAELGISKLVLFTCERTVPRPEKDKLDHKLARLRAIAREAAEQSNRASVPEVNGILSFDELLQQVTQFDLALIAWEDERGSLLRQTLSDAKPGSRIVLIVGPEGGFSGREVEMAREAGAVSVSLGARILRTETAAIAGCAVILHMTEQACGQE